MDGAVADEYQSLYRKYRPQSPGEVLGQEHVVRALVGAINEGRLAHAFLFCGPRGTGKTSTARILAKMVNCEKGPTAEPCGECEQCVRIRDGSHLDVVEIDAASHGGVDDARELRERAPTAPAMGREKVYILDEAQRLSREAFDALLKLFEEPPPGVRFVLCTTEPHKMPATIVGRCQRFDFRRGTSDLLAGHLIQIAKNEGATLSHEAAVAMARQAEGSFRDALSLLDQATVLGGNEIDEDVVEQLLGPTKAESQYALADAVAVGDTKSVFSILDRLVQDGQDLRHLTAESLKHFRNLLLAQSAPGQTDLFDVPEDEYERVRAQAQKFSPQELARVIALLLAAQTDMRWTTSPRLTLELALVRATMPEADPQPEALIARLERLERRAGMDVHSHEGSHEGGPSRDVAPGAAPVAQSTDDAKARRSRSSAARPTPSDDADSDAEADGPVPAEASPSSEEDGPSQAEATSARGDADGPVRGEATSARDDASGDSPDARRPEPRAEPARTSGGDVDVEMLRRSWPAVIEHLKSARQMVLFASLQTATPAAYDGSTLELAFAPKTEFSVSKVEQRAGDLREALQAVLGISPEVRCVVREPVVGGVAVVEDDEPAPDEDAALERLKAELNAEIADD
jgi:DNA polymerase III subunit gamma/tau